MKWFFTAIILGIVISCILMDEKMINGMNASRISGRVWMDEVKDYDANESKPQQPQVISIQKNF